MKNANLIEGPEAVRRVDKSLALFCRFRAPSF